MLNSPGDVARDPSSGAIYVADSQNNVIRKIQNGTITTVAGNGGWGFSDGGGSAREARFARPTGIDVDRAGVLYIADSENNRIRKVSGAAIETVVGTGDWNSTGDGGQAKSATLRTPADVVVADDGTLYISDTGSNRIRRVGTNGIITAFAGNGFSGFSGDGGNATLAKLYSPSHLGIDSGGNLFIADSSNNRVRRVAAANQLIETVAGTGQTGNSGDGGLATSARISAPSGAAVDPTGGTLFVASRDTACVRVVDFDGAVVPTSTAVFTATPIPQQPTATRTATRTFTNTPTTAPASVAVSGVVSYYANSQVRVPGVEVDLTGPLTQTVITTSTGSYNASNIPTGTWEIQPAKSGSIGTAVSSLDASRVLQVISGSRSFNALENLACDVTGDGTLSVLDAVRILQLSAGVITQLPAAQACRSDWLFYPRPDPAQNQTVAVPSLTSSSCRQGNILLNPMLTTVQDQDFDGILLGDCTGNWTPTAGGALRLTAPSGVTVHAGSLRRAPGKRFRMPIYVQGQESFQALDVRLAIDGAALTLRSARPRAAATEALSSVHRVGNTITISVASAEPIDARRGSVVMAEFSGDAAAADAASVRLLSAQVDEQTARLVTHRPD
jgi:DNA-binding beta-propeller fold protein YncE